MSAFDKYHINDLPEETYSVDNDMDWASSCLEDVSIGMQEFYSFFDYLIETINSTNKKSTYLRRPNYLKIINALKDEISSLYTDHIISVFEDLCDKLTDDTMSNTDEIVELWEELKVLMETFHESVAIGASLKENDCVNENVDYNFSISNEIINDIQRFVAYQTPNKRKQKEVTKDNNQKLTGTMLEGLIGLFKLSGMSDQEIEEKISEIKSKV